MCGRLTQDFFQDFPRSFHSFQLIAHEKTAKLGKLVKVACVNNYFQNN